MTQHHIARNSPATIGVRELAHISKTIHAFPHFLDLFVSFSGLDLFLTWDFLKKMTKIIIKEKKLKKDQKKVIHKLPLELIKNQKHFISTYKPGKDQVEGVLEDCQNLGNNREMYGCHRAGIRQS
jgi:hypothetical protein